MQTLAFDAHSLLDEIRNYCITNFGELLGVAHINFITVERSNGVVDIYLPKIFCNRAAFLVEILIRLSRSYNTCFNLHVTCNQDGSLADLGFLPRGDYWSKTIT